MTVFYTKEKGKFGGTTGTIIPFMTQLPDTNIPNVGDWKPLLPAGFLRCDGSILDADQFPVLAAVIGTGEDCPFAKQPLVNPDTFQLPDLGSKYIRGSLSSGEYFFDSVLQSETGLKKVGTEVEVELLKGNVITIDYDGSFDLVPISEPIFFTGNPTYTSTFFDGNTQDDILTENNFQAHGHDADVGVFTYLGRWTDSRFVDNDGFSTGDNEGAFTGANETTFIPNAQGATVNASHNHAINLPKGSDLGSPANLDFKFIYDFSSGIFEPTGLQTTVNVDVEDLVKLDNAISPYYVVEYIIKI